MAKRREVSCADCYFRQSGLCALQLETPCPTFRHHSRGRLVPPRQPRLIAHSLPRITEHAAA